MMATTTLSEAIAADHEVKQLNEEIKRLQERQAQCMHLLNHRIQAIRQDQNLADENIDAESLLERAPEEMEAFKLSFNQCHSLSPEERWGLVNECYKVDEDDEMDMIPSLKSELHTLLSEFELKMGDEFPRMVLMRLVQLYRWIKTFRRRFAQHAGFSAADARIVNKFVYKSARLLEDDMVYVLEWRMRGIEFKLAQTFANKQSNVPASVPPARAATVRQSAFRPIAVPSQSGFWTSRPKLI
uniref:Uncharacterized protein n=1 Tax=Spongospora subterranea TaxID=70186 RepID=A0A0H5QGQ2_9EUKA|eukprot:CRZ00486.1 hypothetical protein [Spongospora subterranea]